MSRDFSAIDTCIFDLYGTLVDIHTDEQAIGVWEKLALFYGYYGADFRPEELREAFSKETHRQTEVLAAQQRASQEGYPEIRIEYVFQKLFRLRGVEADERLSVHAGQFFRVLTTEYERLYDGAKELLASLREAGKRVYLLSNAQRIFTEYEMRALGIVPYFDGIFISSDHGCKKPDLRFYEILLQTCGVNPQKAVMIGNDKNCDIRGARAAGLATIYIASNLSPKESVTAEEADAVLSEMDLRKVRDILLPKR